MDGRWCERYCSFYLHFYFLRAAVSQAFSNILFRRAVLQLSSACILEAFIDRGIVGSVQHLFGERLWYEFDGYHDRFLVPKGRLVSHVLMIIMWSRGEMAAHCDFGCLFSKQKRKNAVFSIYIADNGEENECRARCCCWFHIGIAVRGDRDREDDTILRERIFDDDMF